MVGYDCVRFGFGLLWCMVVGAGVWIFRIFVILGAGWICGWGGCYLFGFVSIVRFGCGFGLWILVVLAFICCLCFVYVC